MDRTYHIAPDDPPADRLAQIASMADDGLVTITALRSQWREAVAGIGSKQMVLLAIGVRKFAPDLAAQLISRWQATEYEALERLLTVLREPRP